MIPGSLPLSAFSSMHLIGLTSTFPIWMVGIAARIMVGAQKRVTESPTDFTRVKPHHSLGCSDLQSLPAQYMFLADDVDLLTETAQSLQTRVKESLPYAKILSIQRFANKFLWESYSKLLQKVEEDDDTNVMLMFHGTTSNNNCFDPRLASADARN